jgi:hypothetical protein
VVDTREDFQHKCRPANGGRIGLIKKAMLASSLTATDISTALGHQFVGLGRYLNLFKAKYSRVIV